MFFLFVYDSIYYIDTKHYWDDFVWKIIYYKLSYYRYWSIRKKKERSPFQRGQSEGHRCPRGVYGPIEQGSVGSEAGVQMCYYPAASPYQLMAVLSGSRMTRVLCVWVAASCCVAACECGGVAAECARWRLTAPGSASTKRFLFLIMPKRRDCAKSVS